MKTRQNIQSLFASAALMLTMLTPTVAIAQDYVNTPVEISTEKVRINGHICYSHIVLERQTLFSISKAYEVSIEDIYKFNPMLKEQGLKKNSIIMIPSKDAVASAQDKKQEKKQEKKPEKKQEEGKKPFFWEPQSGKDKTAETPASSERTPRLHTAKWYEDLETIADQYNVSVEDIMTLNNLQGRKLYRGQKLMIPYPGETIVKPAESQESALTLETFEQESKDTLKSIFNSSDFFARLFQRRIPVKASVILPLTTEDGKPNRNNMDFYCGILLAVYDMAEKGVDCTLNVFDMMDAESPVSVESFIDSDVIIGPISQADLTRMTTIAPNAKAIISPLDPRAESLARQHSNLFHIPTPHQQQYIDLINWIEEDNLEGDKIVLITEKGARQTNTTSVLISQLEKSSLQYMPFSYSILEGRDVTEPLTALMTKEGTNRVIVASESEAFVNDVIRNLNLLVFNKLNISLYAPSKTKGFETIEVDNLHNTSIHMSLGYHTDYESEDVKKFLMRYRALYNTEPSQFAFQGYDTAYYFLDMCSKHGDTWQDHVTEAPQEMLQSTFDFKKQPYGGYVNMGVRRIAFGKDYTIEKVK